MRGVFDECQDIVKALAGDLDFKSAHRLGAVNSINWARIAAQVVYYVWGWLRATQGAGQPVSFTVPSGNFGNILAGHIAREMGVNLREPSAEKFNQWLGLPADSKLIRFWRLDNLAARRKHSRSRCGALADPRDPGPVGRPRHAAIAIK